MVFKSLCKAVFYTAIMGGSFYMGYSTGYDRGTEIESVKGSVSLEKPIFDNSVIKDLETGVRYIPHFKEKTLEEVTTDTYHKKEDEKLKRIFEKER